ncbi:hypothetical protein V6N13_122854 [Hibiscus sabdariffa]
MTTEQDQPGSIPSRRPSPHGPQHTTLGRGGGHNEARGIVRVEGQKCTSYERTGPRPLRLTEIFRIRKHDLSIDAPDVVESCRSTHSGHRGTTEVHQAATSGVGSGQGVGWVAQQQYPLRLDQHRANEIVHQHDQKPRVVGRVGVTNSPPPTGAWPGLGTCRAMHKPLQRNLARYRELVMESLAAPPKRFLALRPTMPGEFDIVRDP